ncbi:MAG: TRL-like family protein [Leptospiraceae bacterium]|nr:TRL-like family protein [Leptospiraceae bacterium]MCP5494859.1 TRL-like family protein [Leptospiraceae bacterium]
MDYKIRKFWTILLFLPLLACTGFTVRAAYYPLSKTNPTEYDNSTAFYKGGGVYHKNTTSGQLGFNAGSERIGKACASSVLWLIASGDASIYEAMSDGKISKISSIEYEQFAILGFVYHRFCTIIRGS